MGVTLGRISQYLPDADVGVLWASSAVGCTPPAAPLATAAYTRSP